MSYKKKFLTVILLIFFSGGQAHASSSSGRTFMMSVIYGTLAGTLIGAATLAFTSNPSGNLNNVARGASYGLYGGILMGLYINSLDEEETERKVEQGPGGEEGEVPIEAPPADSESRVNQKNNLNLAFKPFLVPPPQLGGQWGGGVNFIEVKF